MRTQPPAARTLGAALLVLSVATPLSLAAGDASQLGVFEGASDIGGARAGSTTYDGATGQYTVEGAGANMWSDHDAFHGVWKRLSGDFILRARARFIGEGAHPHRKMGWIVRSDLSPDSAYADVAVHGDGLTSLQFRRSKGGTTEEVRSVVTKPEVIQLSREGDSFTMAVATFGDELTRDRVEGLVLGDEVYVGLFVCSHDEETVERAVFDNVRIVRPAPAGYVPYRDYIGSRLEILDVETGDREVVHTSPGSFQAPNWTPDGRSLIFNQDGRLYRFDLADRTPHEIDSGFATANNNDHVISFDGTRLGISHHSPEHGNQSIVYTLPIEGGTPTQVTARGPSYLHGWSPDDDFLIYTAERDGDYDIYRIPVAGGDEVRLTQSPGLDDGSEYAPNGKHIYFNSARTGSMEIWRMAADGSDPEQLTDDEQQNWFPHVSPDGSRLVFLSYPPSVDPADHPFYREVMLRLMPVDGGRPRVAAYLYGGQGTINVPSWSPDGKRLAFVSNTLEP